MSVDVLALIVAALSLTASVYVFVQQRIDNGRERQVDVARQDYGVMLDLYQRWLATDEQECRKALYMARDSGVLFVDLTPETKARINHAVATMNVVAVLRSAERMAQPESDELFGSAMVRLVRAAEAIGYFEWRQALTGSAPWPRLRAAADDIERANLVLKTP